MEKIMGVGLKNAVLIALFVMVVIVMLKTILVKHPVPGLTEVVATV